MARGILQSKLSTFVYHWEKMNSVYVIMRRNSIEIHCAIRYDNQQNPCLITAKTVFVGIKAQKNISDMLLVQITAKKQFLQISFHLNWHSHIFLAVLTHVLGRFWPVLKSWVTIRNVSFLIPMPTEKKQTLLHTLYKFLRFYHPFGEVLIPL